MGRERTARDATVRKIMKSCIAEGKLRNCTCENSCRSDVEKSNHVSGIPSVLYICREEGKRSAWGSVTPHNDIIGRNTDAPVSHIATSSYVCQDG